MPSCCSHKFLHDLTGSGQTLLQDTWDRLLPLTPADRIVVVTGRVHEEAVNEQLEDLVAANLVLEKSPKDSTAAIALAAAILQKRQPDVIVLDQSHAPLIVMPLVVRL